MSRLLLALWLLQAGPQAAGVVTGIVRSSNGTPTAGVRVYAVTYRDAVEAAQAPPALDSLTVTDAAGKYRLEIPPGRYHIASGSVASPTYFPGTTDISAARVISVAANEVVSAIDFGSFVPANRTPTGLAIAPRVPAGNGTLTGVLRYPDGGPASGIRAAAVPVSTINQGFLVNGALSAGALANLVRSQANQALFVSGPSGQYRLDFLTPDTYYIVAGYSDAPIFYPGTPDIAKAKTITTAVNSRIDNLNFTVLPSPPGVTISGRVLTSADLPATGAGVQIRSTSAAPVLPGLFGLSLRNPPKEAIVGADGTFAFADVSAGDFVVDTRYSGIQGQSQNIVVAGQPIDSLRFVLPIAMVTGRILMEDGGPVPDPRLFADAIVTTVNNPNIIASTIFPIAANGTFTRLHESGEYRFYLRALPEEYEIKSMRFGDADLMKENLKITGQVPVDVEVRVAKRTSPRATGEVRVSGTAIDTVSGLPGGERITLCCRTSGPVERFSALLKADGSFEFAAVPPGKYSPGIQPAAGKPNIYVVESVVDVGIRDLTGVAISTTQQYGQISATLMSDGASLPNSVRPSIVFIGPMGRTRVVVDRVPAGNFQTSVPLGVKYDVSVENLPDGYEVKSITGEAVPVTTGAVNTRPLIIVIGRK